MLGHPLLVHPSVGSRAKALPSGMCARMHANKAAVHANRTDCCSQSHASLPSGLRRACCSLQSVAALPPSMCRKCEEEATYTNWQELRVQEHNSASPTVGAPKSLTLLLQDDLADSCQVGGKPCGCCYACAVCAKGTACGLCNACAVVACMAAKLAVRFGRLTSLCARMMQMLWRSQVSSCVSLGLSYLACAARCACRHGSHFSDLQGVDDLMLAHDVELASARAN